MEHLLSKVFEKHGYTPEQQLVFVDLLIGTSKGEDHQEHIKIYKEIKQMILDGVAEKELLGDSNEPTKS